MRFIFITLIYLSCIALQGQEDSAEFPAHEVISVISRKPYFTGSSEQTINRENLERQYPYSLVSAVNTIPGARMEERSPGSYRLSVRGSLLRSPFGVRNVKIYLGPFPFTDAGGNTYLNSLDMSFINSITILKGPQSGIYGANTGGVVLIDPVLSFDTDSSTLTVNAGLGSYNLFRQSIQARQRFRKGSLSISQAYQQSNGYRVHSGMDRQYLQASYKWNYHPKASLNILGLYSDLFYETPGGLTRTQYNVNPRQARPPTPTLPGAEQQKASVSNRTVFGGISNAWNIKPRLYYVFSVFGSGTRFANPFITNYEQRFENNFGLRTSLDYRNRSSYLTHRFNLGAELQQGHFSIENYGNRLGRRDTMQAADALRSRQGFVFFNFVQSSFYHTITASLSYNFFNYTYRHIYPFPGPSRTKNFTPKLMSNMSVSYQLVRNMLSLWVAAGTGYSSPTIAEVRASDNVVNTSLQAETGTNLETGIKFADRTRRLKCELSAFHFILDDAIVRRTDTAGNEFFINAGGTNQNGLEAQVSSVVVSTREKGLVRGLDVLANTTYYEFRFRNYMINGTDYSRKRVTGVPPFTFMGNMCIRFASNFSFFAQYYKASAIVLNDVNSVKADPYSLIQVKIQWQHRFRNKELTVFAGSDNLLNETYSLGNDLNAAGDRFFNAAPPRNYYGGAKFRLY